MHRWNKVALVVSADLISLPLCFMIAVLLRVGDIGLVMTYSAKPYLLISLITVSVFATAGLYGAVVRFIDHHLLATAGAGLAVAVAFGYLVLSFLDIGRFPYNALAIYWFIAFSYVVTSRLVARILLRRCYADLPANPGQAVAIYGAGEAGVKLATAMRAGTIYRPVCFLDDTRALDNRSVAGLKVVHSDRLVETVAQKHIELIVIAIPSATPAQRREIMYRAKRTNAQVKILCSLVELQDQAITTRSIRELKIEDLLGREPIRPDHHLFSKCVTGQSILVTGGGGSIGSELCRQIMTQNPSELHILDHSEFSLYQIEKELTECYPQARIYAHLGSACDALLVERVISDCRVNTIYHAAAYKHVPLVENNIAEAVRNNVESALVVANAAQKDHVRTCVLVSSDKAVRPMSVMGASKRVAELIFQAAAIKSTTGTRFCMVRFGNVLGSSGSVVPLFKRQIEKGGPITITHPDVVRYFMSIPEAAQLVMQAGAMALGGDVFVMDMGEPVKIVHLARTMIAMSGLTERDAENRDGDIEIRYIGLRSGEKLYEELFTSQGAARSKHPRIMTTSEYVVEPGELNQQLTYLMAACDTNDKAMIKYLMQKLVIGFTTQIQEDDAPETADGFRTGFARPFRKRSLLLAENFRIRG